MKTPPLTQEQRKNLAAKVQQRGYDLLCGVYDGTYSMKHVFDVIRHEIETGELK